MTRPDIDAIEKQAAAATNWSMLALRWLLRFGRRNSGSWYEDEDIAEGEYCPAEEAADFIANARTDVPALCAYVRELEHIIRLSCPDCVMALMQRPCAAHADHLP